MTNNALRVIALTVFCLVVGICGYFAASFAKHAWDDHVLVDEIRRINQQQLLDAARQQQAQPQK